MGETVKPVCGLFGKKVMREGKQKKLKIINPITKKKKKKKKKKQTCSRSGTRTITKRNWGKKSAFTAKGGQTLSFNWNTSGIEKETRRGVPWKSRMKLTAKVLK